MLLTLFLSSGVVKEIDQSENRRGIKWLYGIKASWRECYLRTHELGRCQNTGSMPIYPQASDTHLQDKLDFLEQRHLNLFRRWGAGPNLSPTVAGRAG